MQAGPPSPSAAWRYARRRSVLLTALSLLCTIFAHRQAPACDVQVVKDAASCLLLDHSSSMTQEPTCKNPTQSSRWLQLTADLLQTIDSLALDQDVWIGVFEGRPGDETQDQNGKWRWTPNEKTKTVLVLEEHTFPLKTEVNRAALKQWVLSLREEGRAPPQLYVNTTGKGGTALFDSKALTLAKAEESASQYPGRRVRVRVFSDGADEHSALYRSEADLERQFPRFYGKDPLRVIDDLAIDKPYKVQLNCDVDNPQALECPKAAAGPTGAAEYKGVRAPLVAEPSVIAVLAKAGCPPFELQYDPTKDAGSKAGGLLPDVTIGTAQLAVEADGAGKQKAFVVFDLTVKNARELNPEEPYRCALRIRPPVLEQYELRGRCSLQVLFKRADKPSIFYYWPKDGLEFTTGQEIDFKVATDAPKIEWTFGDGAGSDSASPSHQYKLAGEQKVTVTVTDPKTGLSDSRSSVLKVVRLELALERLPPTLLAGVPFDLKCDPQKTTLEHIKRIEWQAFKAGAQDGTPAWAGSTDDPGKPVTCRLNEPAAYRFVVKGISRFHTITQEVASTVHPPPTLALIRPVPNEEIQLGEQVQALAQVNDPAGVVERVHWTVMAENEEKQQVTVYDDDCSVAQGAAVLAFSLKKELGAGKYTITVKARLKAGYQAPDALVCTVSGPVPPPGLGIKIVEPAAERPLYFGTDVTCMATARGDVDTIHWTLEPPQLAAKTIEDSKVDKGAAITRWSIPWADLKGAQTATLKAVGQVAASVKAKAPEQVISRQIIFPEVKAALKVLPEGKSEFKWNEPLSFELECSQTPPKPNSFYKAPEFKIAWDFGDGSDAATCRDKTKLNRAFNRRGAYNVRVTVTGCGGKHDQKVAAVVLKALPPQVKCLTRKNFYLRNTVLPLECEKAGDVAAALWTLNGAPIPPEQKNVCLDTAARNTLAVTLRGPPDEKGACEEVSCAETFWVFPWWALFVVLPVLIVALGFGGALLIAWCTGNEPRNYHVRYNESGKAEHLANSLRVAKFWSRRFERAEIPVRALVLTPFYLKSGIKLRVEHHSGSDGNLRGQIIYPAENGTYRLDQHGESKTLRSYRLIHIDSSNQEIPESQVFLYVEDKGAKYRACGANCLDKLGVMVGAVSILAAVGGLALFAVVLVGLLR